MFPRESHKIEYLEKTAREGDLIYVPGAKYHDPDSNEDQIVDQISPLQAACAPFVAVGT